MRVRPDLRIVALVAGLATLALPLRAPAATLEVPADYATIQEAIDAAADGDFVLVAPGTYFESLTLAGKSVILASHFLTTGDPAFIDQTVIDGGGGNEVIFVGPTAGPGTTVNGFTIQNADDGIRAKARFQLLHSRITGTVDGLDYFDGGGLVRNCIFEGNDDDGIDLDGDVAVVIENNLIIDNGGSPGPDGDGIEIRLQPYNGPLLEVVIRNNRIERNTSDGIQLIGYDVETQRSYRIEGNTFVDNRLAAIGMMCCTDSSEDFQGASLPERVLIARNTFAGNDHGISGGDNVIALDNLFVSTTNIALKRVDGASIAAFNGFWNNGVDDSESNVDAATSLYADPLLDANQELLPGSPAEDAGTAFYMHLGELVLDLPATAFAGAAPELGAFEIGGVGPVNEPPFVDAGPDQVLPSGASAALAGFANDDGLPSGSLDLAWSVVTGPGSVSFADPTAGVTTASFSQNGVYVLRLAADDSDLTASDDVRITLTPAAEILDLPLVSGSDDAEEAIATGSVDLSSATLEMGDVAAQRVGLRWPSVDVPPGSQIHSAWVQFQSAAPALAPADLEIRGELVADAAAFTTAPGDLSARPLTSAWSTWQPPAWLTVGHAGLDQRTADLSAVIEEIVNETAWQEGNALALFVEGSGLRTADAFEGTPGGAALLHLSFSPPLQNQPPVVDAGPDRSILLGQQASLDGSVVDDGLPEGQALSTLWSVVSGPGTVTFAVPSDPATQAEFSAPGVYVLRLTADDGELSAYEEMQVGVQVNLPPSVDAGPDQQVMLPAPATLAGSVSDDGLPSGQLSVLWTPLSGPGVVTFDAPTSTSTLAHFSAPGVYVLQLSASDGAVAASDELQVTVQQNQAPVVDAGPDSSVVFPDPAALSGSVSDDGLPQGQSLSIQWSLASGPGTVTFTAPSSASTQAQFSAPGLYLLRLTADDGELSSMDQVQVDVTTNQAPIVNAGPDRSILLPNSAILTGSASDDGLPGGGLAFLWTLQSGPGQVTFGIPTDSATSARFSAPGLYVLRLSADDGELSGFDEMRVAVALQDDGLFDTKIDGPGGDAEENLHKNDVTLDNTTLEIGQQSFGPRRSQLVALRFPGVDVPAGATILSASVELTAAANSSGSSGLTLEAEDTDDAAAFQAADRNLSDRTRTSASVAWSPSSWSAGSRESTPDLSALVQEVVERSGWAPGNALVVLLSGSGTRSAHSHEGSTSGAAWLYVDYQVATCGDGLDNDGDGLVDFPDDPGCASASANTENPACSDGIDNDGNGTADFPEDPGCADPAGSVELSDSDGDGLSDGADNCIEVANPLQRDTNGDGYGNVCDLDVDNNGVVGLSDFSIVTNAFGRTCGDPAWDPDLDVDDDCVIGLPDYGAVVSGFGQPPGPSGLAP